MVVSVYRDRTIIQI